MTILRRNVNSLSKALRDKYVAGVQALQKTDTLYTKAFRANVWSNVKIFDWYVANHVSSRPRWHQTPWFLPWHRQFIKQFEMDLQIVLGDPTFGLPYWDWAEDARLLNPVTAPVWQADFMGQFPVRRALGAKGSLPTPDDVNAAIKVEPYDSSPWIGTRPSANFRSALEQVHDRVHGWVGGQMDDPSKAPSDPVFYLHHCNIDRIFWKWQAQAQINEYLPSFATGTEFDDWLNMSPWNGSAYDTQRRGDAFPILRNTRPKDVWSINNQDYSYRYVDWDGLTGNFQISSVKYVGQYITAPIAYNGWLALQQATDDVYSKWTFEVQQDGTYRIKNSGRTGAAYIGASSGNDESLCYEYNSWTEPAPHLNWVIDYVQSTATTDNKPRVKFENQKFPGLYLASPRGSNSGRVNLYSDPDVIPWFLESTS